MTSNPEQKRKLGELLDRVPHFVYWNGAWSDGNGGSDYRDRDTQQARAERAAQKGRD